MIPPLTSKPCTADLLGRPGLASFAPEPADDIAGTGVAMHHLEGLRRFAQRHRVIVGIRKVEACATRLIERGFQTKNFHIKGKSSNWGPMNGLIPVNQALSKLVDANAKRVAKADADVAACLGKRLGIDDPFAPTHLTPEQSRARIVAGPLLLTDEELAALEHADPTLRRDPHPPTARRIVIRATPEATGQPHVFTGARSDDGRWLVRFHGATLPGPNADGSIVEIVCYEMRAPPRPLACSHPVRMASAPDDHLLHPVTADYDLLLFAPEWSAYGPTDTRPLVHPSEHEFRRVRGQAGRRLTPYLAPEDPHLGNCSARLRSALPLLNEAVSDGRYRPLFHHSDDVNSPYTELNANFPALLVYPDTTHDAVHGRAEVIATADAFALRFDTLKERFALFWHPSWDTELIGARR